MFWAMTVSAWPARVAGASSSSAPAMAARTSGGRSVDVRVMRSIRLSRKAGSIGRPVYRPPSGGMIEGAGRRRARTHEMPQKYRLERDPLGEVRVPAGAYYGAQTQRAVENFPISGMTAHAELVDATIQI